MIRAGRGGAYAADWLERGIIGIGWDFGGADIATMDREKIRAAYTAAHPSESKQKVAANVDQVYSSNASSNSPKCPNKNACGAVMLLTMALGMTSDSSHRGSICLNGSFLARWTKRPFQQ